MLFTPIKISGLQIQNRFIRSATHEWLCEEDGTPTQAIGDIYETLARYDVGLIITGYSYVNPSGKSSKRQQGIYSDRFIDPYRMITERVHRYNCKIALQIVHGGRQALVTPDYPVPLAPSAVRDSSSGITPAIMDEKQILKTIEDFAQAVRRAQAAGFDIVQLHMAHGFLLSSFISPYTNRRTDYWGGSVENRMHIITKIMERSRELVGVDYPVMVKMNATDGFSNYGLDAPECVEIACLSESAGICAIEVSGGIFEAGEIMAQQGIDAKEKEAYFKDYAKMIKEAVDVPVILVGGLRSKAVMGQMLTKGYADMVSLSRPFIREPDLVVKFRDKGVDKAQCISCNECFNENGVKCSMR
ncbi:MAG: NADH:flavin oxidoreductase [Candidatus Methanomarinus sp.]|uniref:NADH:flavin oxidoreductase n=1 Tax=Candidatus Methanomarinus sp. TaxID=3386244 RepID=A0AC61SCM3_9EURY|nr:MAG: NADH:flavin oxidoreductase [ANME-2 cluster archaeon]